MSREVLLIFIVRSHVQARRVDRQREREGRDGADFRVSPCTASIGASRVCVPSNKSPGILRFFFSAPSVASVYAECATASRRCK
jgi:uncharacterized protein (DUF736 family)